MYTVQRLFRPILKTPFLFAEEASMQLNKSEMNSVSNVMERVTPDQPSAEEKNAEELITVKNGNSNKIQTDNSCGESNSAAQIVSKEEIRKREVKRHPPNDSNNESTSQGHTEQVADSLVKDNATLNMSGNESTTCVLSKALKTLANKEYDMVTPPKQSVKVEESAKKEKKFSLFRPYDLDDRKRDSKSKLPKLPTESPMLLRSNYVDRNSWLIERRQKSELLSNKLLLQPSGYGNVPVVVPVLPKPVERSDQKSLPTVTTFSRSSSQDVRRSLCAVSKICSAMPSEGNVYSKEVTNDDDRLTVPCVPLPRPLKASTPKDSYSPATTEESISVPPKISQHLQLITNYMQKSGDPHTDNINVVASLHPASDSIPVQSSTREMLRVRTPTPELQPVAPARYNSVDGHRLPLKHSYKHQASNVTQQTDRPSTPVNSVNQTSVQTNVKQRFRSLSCPPITKVADVINEVLQRDITSTLSCPSSLVQSMQVLDHKSIFTQSKKAIVEAVKETWALHHSVITSQLPVAENGKPALPSFSTFTNKTLLPKTNFISKVSSRDVPRMSWNENMSSTNISRKQQYSKDDKQILSKTESKDTHKLKEPVVNVVTPFENIVDPNHVKSAQTKVNKPETCISEHIVGLSSKVCQSSDKNQDTTFENGVDKVRTWPITHRMFGPPRERSPLCSDQVEIKTKSVPVYSSHIGSRDYVGGRTNLVTTQQPVFPSSHDIKRRYEQDVRLKSSEAQPTIKLEPKPFISGTIHGHQIYRDPQPLSFSRGGLSTLSPQQPGLRVPGLADTTPIHHFPLNRGFIAPHQALLSPASETRTHVSEIKSMSSETRRPLGQSHLQNQALNPTVETDAKLPMAAMMMMMKVYGISFDIQLSLSLSLSLSVSLCLSLSLCLSVSLCVSPCLSLSLSVSASLSLSLFLSLSLCLPVCLSLSVCLSVSLSPSACLSVSLSLSLSLF